MKILILVARILLGLMFTVFGLNMFLHFIPMPPPPGDAGVMMGLWYTHNWLYFYGFVEAAAGLMLLFRRFVPLALTLLAGVIVNIMLFHLTLAPAGIGPGLFAGLLELILIFAYRASFAGIFAAKAEPSIKA